MVPQQVKVNTTYALADAVSTAPTTTVLFFLSTKNLEVAEAALESRQRPKDRGGGFGLAASLPW